MSGTEKNVRALSNHVMNSQAVLDASPVATVVFNRNERVLYANIQAQNLFAKKITRPGELTCGDFVSCANRNSNPKGCGQTPLCPSCPVFRSLRSVLNENPVQKGEAFLTRDPEYGSMVISYRFSFIGTREARNAIMAVEDITPEKLYQDRNTVDVKKALTTLRTFNQLIARETDPQKLIQKACENLTSNLGYQLAWAALFAPEGGKVDKAACSGLHKSFAYMRNRLYRGEFPACMKRAMETDRPAVIRKSSIACLDCPLASKCPGRAAMIHRLEFGGRTRGVLAVSVNEPRTQNPVERAFFREMANILAFSLGKIESEENLRIQSLTLAQIEDRVIVTDLFGNITYVNNSVCRMLGKTAEQLTGRHVSVLGEDPQKGATQERIIRNTLEKGQWRGEVANIREDGSLVVLDCRTHVIRAPSGQPVGLCGISTDITERKKIEKELKESEERFKTIFQFASVGICLTRVDGRFIMVNQAVCKMFGYTENEMMSMGFEDITHPGDASGSCNALQALLRKDVSSLGFEKRYVNKKGEVVNAMVDTFLFRDQSGTPQYFITHIKDITEKKKLEEQIRLAQKMEAVGALAGGIAHDFNNILFPIIGNSELLLEDLPPGSPEYEMIQTILNAGKRAGDLAKQILDFSRQSEQKVSPVYIQDIIHEAVRFGRSTIPSSIKIAVDVEAGCGLVMADPTHLHQVVMNLMTNAFHAMETGAGSITIGLRETKTEQGGPVGDTLVPGVYAMLTVADTGCGISPDLLSRIFEPYFTTKEKEKGTGLGLAVIDEIVRQYHGHIKVDSKPGKGTTFSVFFPVISKPVTSGENEKDKTSQMGNERILLVDDEPAIVRLEKQMLERLGYRVTEQTGSLGALNAFYENPNGFDLVGHRHGPCRI